MCGTWDVLKIIDSITTGGFKLQTSCMLHEIHLPNWLGYKVK